MAFLRKLYLGIIPLLCFMQSYFSFADFFPGSTPFTSFPASEIFLLSAAAAQQTAHCWMKLFTVHWTHLLIILIQLKVLSRPSFFPCSHFPHHSFWWNSRSLFEKPFGFFQRTSHFFSWASLIFSIIWFFDPSGLRLPENTPEGVRYIGWNASRCSCFPAGNGFSSSAPVRSPKMICTIVSHT